MRRLAETTRARQKERKKSLAVRSRVDDNVVPRGGRGLGDAGAAAALRRRVASFGALDEDPERRDEATALAARAAAAIERARREHKRKRAPGVAVAAPRAEAARIIVAATGAVVGDGARDEIVGRADRAHVLEKEQLRIIGPADRALAVVPPHRALLGIHKKKPLVRLARATVLLERDPRRRQLPRELGELGVLERRERRRGRHPERQDSVVFVFGRPPRRRRVAVAVVRPAVVVVGDPRAAARVRAGAREARGIHVDPLVPLGREAEEVHAHLRARSERVVDDVDDRPGEPLARDHLGVDAIADSEPPRPVAAPVALVRDDAFSERRVRFVPEPARRRHVCEGVAPRVRREPRGEGVALEGVAVAGSGGVGARGRGKDEAHGVAHVVERDGAHEVGGGRFGRRRPAGLLAETAAGRRRRAARRQL
eukprot:CAMPEP_0185702068 /NCGR_PEP_ID=MMETSP1164-20130828/11014_2 /TAXON_ID=1104430 /ORGANISM="Chrysoreinhardia sp, Strain CCMP2950" /LENGTH=425 /DNA_ID=CAMNT_0028369219 /DNA_START=402 /DNA_END=1676 /DNA_ORIENTATION=-